MEKSFEKTVAFGYIRVSTDLQVDKKTDLNQVFLLEKFVNEHPEINLLEKFTDLGISGKERNRAGFNEMSARLKEVNALIVYDIDRLVRDIEIGLELMQLLMKYNVKIYELRTNTVKDLSKDNDQLLYLIGIWYSSVERKKINARQKLGIERYKRERGRWGRKKKPLNIQKYEKLREMGIPKTVCAKILGLNIHTLYNRLTELGVPL